jgi:hypothetical protein
MIPRSIASTSLTTQNSNFTTVPTIGKNGGGPFTRSNNNVSSNLAVTA